MAPGNRRRTRVTAEELRPERRCNFLSISIIVNEYFSTKESEEESRPSKSLGVTCQA